MDQGLQKAITAQGSIAALARELSITRSAICQWDKIPAERVVEIETITGIPRHELRPDLHLSPASIASGKGRAA